MSGGPQEGTSPPAGDRPPEGSLSGKLSSLPPPLLREPQALRKSLGRPRPSAPTRLPTRLSSSALAFWALHSRVGLQPPLLARRRTFCSRSGSVTAPYTLAMGCPFPTAPHSLRAPSGGQPGCRRFTEWGHRPPFSQVQACWSGRFYQQKNRPRKERKT